MLTYLPAAISGYQDTTPRRRTATDDLRLSTRPQRSRQPAGAWAAIASLLVLISTVGLPGCRTREIIVQPSAFVSGVKLIEQTPEGARLEVIVELENPNLTPLPLAHSGYTITIDGVGTYRFADRPRRTLPAGVEEGGSAVGRQTLRLPMAMSGPGNGPAGLTYHVEGSVLYEPPGAIRKLLTESNVPLPSVPFSGTGTIE